MSLDILLVENIHSSALKTLSDQGYRVQTLKHSPSEHELDQLLPKFQIVGIRSKTELRATLLNRHPHLLGIGAFCIGTNQIDLEAAARLGIPVFNAPHSNTRSVAELIMAEIVCLSRQLFDRSTKAHRGEWMKAAMGSHEVRGKTLGIVGYGHIGSQVSILAEAFGMKVIFYDVLKKLPLGNAHPRSSLSEVLKEADFVTLHVPETHQTFEMMGADQLAQMKPTAFLLNASRGSVVQIDALAHQIRTHKLAGCAVDVFPEEPSSNEDVFSSPLQSLSNVILTPHIGGSTEEAQFAIGEEVAESFRKFIQFGCTLGAVQFPQVDLAYRKGVHRILNAHRNEPGVLGEINGVVSRFGANIVAQSLDTNAHVGYVIMDFEQQDSESIQNLVTAIAKLPRSLKTRMI